MKYEVRYACHPGDFKSYDTSRIRDEFLISDLFEDNEIKLVYSLLDRYIVGGVKPTTDTLALEPFLELKAEHFLDRRELGLINVGGDATVVADGTTYTLKFKEALYLGAGTKEVTFASVDAAKPALLYLNSAPAHQAFPSRHVTLEDAKILKLGALESSNERQINQLLVKEVVQTCQLQMGMTELKPGSVWNTMPAHTHLRRMEAYFYFQVPEGQSVCHFMGEPDETRHIWMQNHEAVLSPSWSIHSGAGTSNYIFIWGMAGENLDYTDMDVRQPNELK
ncbi:5-dehydro-4-deoxy-D-glucuronate isomerase [Pelagicoccus sp. SDUM812003]|uniref:5-dehydro-4-deoxy-D-glucuronate isomerase n=1 Tax=Pelagicoccus sp. SDUM812003 TaxID=3041267 RepID=UPI00280D3394|nr:5-dehydro-4-deoxy-D-glucuronate isomerase [Pelagicoccus sp. SDUM812003]MDQ8202636.1 5-dehydro-4-deoxy-D-glucuronate isomerase [Pelagicoccus sp. SDUM812003]